MTRRAFVHIGTHKTATTFLQTWMRLNRNKLRKLDLMFPMIGMHAYDSAHVELSHEVRATRGLLAESKRWRELRSRLEGKGHDVIISAETFSDKIRNADETGRMVRFFDTLGMETVFVVFLRDVPAYINSRYVQIAKHFRTTEAFTSYAKRHLKDRAFNYPLVLKPFEDVAKVLVLPYTRSDEPIQHRFLHALGRDERDMDRIRWKEVPPQNTSFSPDAIYLARRIASRLPSGMSSEEIALKRACFRTLLKKYNLNDGGFVGCDVEFSKFIRSRFSESTEIVAREYFGASWADTVPPESMFENYRAEDHSDRLSPALEDEIVGRVLQVRPSLRTQVTRRVKETIRRQLL